jgi:DNA repair exonuclease SbcCD ATPase subunit
MDTTPPPVIDSEQAYMEKMYSEEEKQKIRQEIENAAGTRLGSSETDWRSFKPKKRGILFPVVVNLCAVAFIVGAWFAADVWFNSRQQSLRLKTDQLFSVEGSLLAKILENSRAQLNAKDKELDRIQADLARLAAEKNNLVQNFNSEMTSKEKALRAELAQELASERLKLQGQGLSEAQIEQRLKDFETQKSAEFNRTLAAYRQKAQAEIAQRTQQLNALQNQLAETKAEKDKLRSEIAAKSERQATALDKLNREREELNLFFRQSDALFRTIHTNLSAGNYPGVQKGLNDLETLFTQADRSGLPAVQARVAAQRVEAATLQNALNLLKQGGVDPRFEAFKAALTRAQGLSSAAERDALVTKAVQNVPEIARAFEILQAWQTQRELAAVEKKLAEARALSVSRGPEAALVLLQSSVNPIALREGINAAWAAYQKEIAKDQAALDALKNQVNPKQLADLQKAVEDLVPYKTRWNHLAELYAQNKKAAFDALTNPVKPNFDEAKKDFLVTFASEDAQSLFPDFDKAISTMGGGPVSLDPRPIRDKAFDDVLLVTNYLGGHSPDAKYDQEQAGILSLQDPKYRDVVASIQALLNKGAVEAPVGTATSSFWGSLVSLEGSLAIIEPFAHLNAKVGQTVEIRHRRGTANSLVATGTILSIAPDRVTAQVNPVADAPFAAVSGDGVYLRLN